MFGVLGRPPMLPGVSVLPLLAHALARRSGRDVSARELRRLITEWTERLDIDPLVVDRPLHSLVAAELRSLELLQVAVLRPGVTIFDPGTNLDADDVSTIRRQIGELGAANEDSGFLLITDDPQLAAAVCADHVDAMIDGRSVPRAAGTSVHTGRTATLEAVN
jgi:Fe-S cluster assembly ATPase SufC